jgi:hypothetical protein
MIKKLYKKRKRQIGNPLNEKISLSFRIFLNVLEN